jgi:KUP system potassium uptake protein
MRFHFWLKDLSLSEARSFGLDMSYVTVEKFALVVAPIKNLQLKRIFKGEEY